VLSFAERPDLDERWEETVRPAWPEFLLHDATMNANWERIFEGPLAEFQLFVYDEEADQVLGVGNCAPFAWDGDPATLPNGIDEVVPLAIEQSERGIPATAISALQAVVTPGNQGKGLSRVIVGAMRDHGVRLGLRDLVAPVRPTWKHRYPLVPMERYVTWLRADGLPFDPWLRVHARLGAQFIGVCERSMTVTGTVADWETWTGMAFPNSGAYIVPGALVPVVIDRERDEGRYVEPNVWMRHRLGG